MMNHKIRYTYTILALLLLSCNKSNFLNEKPGTDINTPTKLSDFRNILDNTEVMNYTGGLAQLASDDYEVTYANWQGASSTQRNSYTWQKSLYNGDLAIKDWNDLYREVFYANVVLEGLASSGFADTAGAAELRGWALFARSYAFYDLTRNFCPAYNSSTTATDLGIPLRLSSNIDYLQKRGSLQESFDRILVDLKESAALLPASRPSANLNRPWKAAAFALLARVYLDMRDYSQTEYYADECLKLYNTLIDYNAVSKSSATPFSTTNDELIYNSTQVTDYTFTVTSTSSRGMISPALINLYGTGDLRLNVYFSKSADGIYRKKRGYNGSGLYHFTGLATDELYLIKAECLARRGEAQSSMDVLNDLLIKRYQNTSPYVPLTAASGEEALNKVLAERRKELVWRGLRWHDLKRLNREGRNISLSRSLNGNTYTLAPDGPRWVFPIPDDEIALSGIQQNDR